MKRKLFTAFVIMAAISFTACQEDTAMDEMEQLIQDTELEGIENGNGTGSGGDGSGGNGDDPPGGN